MDHNEQIISNFLKTPQEGGAYLDEKLATLLAHAEDGRLVFDSCCCLIGIPTADHALQGRVSSFEQYLDPHYHLAKYGKTDPKSSIFMEPLPGIGEVERAFLELASNRQDDALRRAKLIPLIHAEMSRRESLRAQTEVSEVVMA